LVCIPKIIYTDAKQREQPEQLFTWFIHKIQNLMNLINLPMFYFPYLSIMKTMLFSKIKIIISIILLITIMSFSDSCKKSTDTQETPGTNEVFIQGLAFNPSTITITANTTITWTNKDGIAHTVTSNTGLFDSESISSNGTYSHLFATAGSFPYHCTIHPTMTGTVIVN